MHIKVMVLIKLLSISAPYYNNNNNNIIIILLINVPLCSNNHTPAAACIDGMMKLVTSVLTTIDQHKVAGQECVC